MKRSALNKRANISNNPKIIKLYKKSKWKSYDRIFPKVYATRHIF